MCSLARNESAASGTPGTTHSRTDESRNCHVFAGARRSTLFVASSYQAVRPFERVKDQNWLSQQRRKKAEISLSMVEKVSWRWSRKRLLLFDHGGRNNLLFERGRLFECHDQLLLLLSLWSFAWYWIGQSGCRTPTHGKPGKPVHFSLSLHFLSVIEALEAAKNPLWPLSAEEKWVPLSTPVQYLIWGTRICLLVACNLSDCDVHTRCHGEVVIDVLSVDLPDCATTGDDPMEAVAGISGSELLTYDRSLQFCPMVWTTTLLD